MNTNEKRVEQLSPLDYRRELGKVEVDLEKVGKNIYSRKQSIKKMESEETIQSYLAILQKPEVKKYLEKKEEIHDLEYLANNLAETKKYLFQHLCKHPAVLVTKETIVNGKILNSGICLGCLRSFEELQDENLEIEALLYYKERSENYFLTHDEIMAAMEDFKEVKREKRCSDKKAVRVLNRRRR